MSISCGTDIIEIERIKKAIEQQNGFKEKIYTIKEITYCESKKNTKYEHYAARFAAKEAIYKAIQKLLGKHQSITWQNAEIQNDEKGKPYIHFLNIKIPNMQNIELSLSHCKQYAVATVIVEYKEG